MALWKAFLVLLLVHGNLFSASKLPTDALAWNAYGSSPQDPAVVHFNDFTHKNSQLMSARGSETATEKRSFFSKFASFFKSKNKKVDEHSSGNVQQDEDYGKISENNYEGFKARASKNKHFRVPTSAVSINNPEAYDMDRSEEYQGQEGDGTNEDDNFEQYDDGYNSHKIAGYENIGEDSSNHESKARKIKYMPRIKFPVMQQTKKVRQRPPRFFKSIFKKIKALFSSKKNKTSHASGKEESNIKESSSGDTGKKTSKQEPTQNFRPIYQNPIVQSEKGTDYLEQQDENSNQAMTQDIELLPNEENYSDDDTEKEEKYSDEHNTRADDHGIDYVDDAKSPNEGLNSDKIEYPDEVEYPSEDSYQDEVAIPSKQYPAEERSSVEEKAIEGENNLYENDKTFGNNTDNLDKSDYPEDDDYADKVNTPSNDYRVEGGEENYVDTEGGISGGNEEYPNKTEYPEGDDYLDEIQDPNDYPTTEKNPEGEDYPAEEEYPTQNEHAEGYYKDNYPSETGYSGIKDYQGQVANSDENYDDSDVIIPSNEYQVGKLNSEVKENGAAESISEVKNVSEPLMTGKIYPGIRHYGVREEFPGNQDQKERKEEYINAAEFLKEKLMHLKNEEKFLDDILDYSNGQISANQFPVDYANPSWPYVHIGTRYEQPIPFAWSKPIPQNLPGYNGGVLPNYRMSQGPLPVYYPNQWQPLVYPAPIIGG